MQFAAFMQSQTHGYTDYPYLDEATKAGLAAKLQHVAAMATVPETTELAAVEAPTAVAAA